MYSAFLLLICVSTGFSRSVDRRNTGVGSAASASGNGPMFLFPNNGKNATTTQEPKATDRPLSVAQAAKLVELYRQLGCLSIGSSADGNVYENVIQFGNETPEKMLKTHIANCTVQLPLCHDKVDLVFLLDASGSVELPNFNKEKTFISQSLSRFVIGPDDAQISVVMYSNQPENAFNLNQFTSEASIINAVNRIPYPAGGTYTSAALKYAGSNSFTTAAGDRPDAKNVLVVITDGKSTDPAKTLAEAQALKQQGVIIIAIGIGSGVDNNELNGIASGSGFVLNVDDFNALSKVYGTIHEFACIIEQTTPAPPTTTPEPTTTTTTPAPTPAPTTPEPTTPEPTTPEPTTPEPTTPEPTTPEPTTPEPTTPEPTTPEPTTPEPTTPEPTTPEPTTPEPTTPEPTTPEPTTAEPTTPEPTTPKPATNSSGTKNETGAITGTEPNKGSTPVPVSVNPPSAGPVTGGVTAEPVTTAPVTNGTEKNNGTGAVTGTEPNKGSTAVPVPTKPAGNNTNTAGNTGTGSNNGTGAVTGTEPNTGAPSAAPNSGTGPTAPTNSGPGTGGTGGNGNGSNNGTGAVTGTEPKTGVPLGGETTVNPVTGNGKTPAGSVDQLPNLNDNTTYNGTSNGECKDLINCRPYLKSKICPDNSTYHPWASVRCRAYCGYCDQHTSPVPCVDRIANCNEYDADLCTNALYRLFREDNCRKFCGLCSSGNAPTKPMSNAPTKPSPSRR